MKNYNIKLRKFAVFHTSRGTSSLPSMNKIRDGRVFSLVHLTWNDPFKDQQSKKIARNRWLQFSVFFTSSLGALHSVIGFLPVLSLLFSKLPSFFHFAVLALLHLSYLHCSLCIDGSHSFPPPFLLHISRQLCLSSVCFVHLPH